MWDTLISVSWAGLDIILVTRVRAGLDPHETSTLKNRNIFRRDLWRIVATDILFWSRQSGRARWRQCQQQTQPVRRQSKLYIIIIITKLASVSLRCKKRRFKTANIRILSANSTQNSYIAITFILVSGLSRRPMFTSDKDMSTPVNTAIRNGSWTWVVCTDRTGCHPIAKVKKVNSV